eukprot:44809_1
MTEQGEQTSVEPIQPTDTQSSFFQCPVCNNYEPIGVGQCSKCNTRFVIQPAIQPIPIVNSNPIIILNQLQPEQNPIDWVHRAKVHGALTTTCCWIIAMLFLLSAYFTAWFSRTPLDSLTVSYYPDHATYNVAIPPFDDTIKYSQCQNKEFHGEYCDNMNDIAHIIPSLIFSSVCLLCMIIIIGILTITPYHIDSCNQNALLLKLSHGRNINKSIIFMLVVAFILFGLTFSTLREFGRLFPYKRFCFYNDYDDYNIGCEWGSGLFMVVMTNCITAHCIVYMILLLITHRYDYTAHKYDQVSNQGQVQSRPSKHCTNSCMFFLAVVLALVYAICVWSVADVIPDSDDGAMAYITNEWNNAQCFDQSGYYTVPNVFDHSYQDVCSFTDPDEPDDVWYPQWWSCCEPKTCSDAFNYTHLVVDASQSCLHAMSVITKGSCHPLSASFTPSSFNITKQSSVERKNGIFICALFCQETWNYCKNMKWFANEPMLPMTVEQIFSDSMDFCLNGLQVQVRSEVFTDKCLDTACSAFNIYLLSFFVIGSILCVM